MTLVKYTFESQIFFFSESMKIVPYFLILCTFLYAVRQSTISRACTVHTSLWM